MCDFSEFLLCLYKYLIGTEDYNNNVIRRHSKNLEKIGEFSFTTDTLTFHVSNVPNKTLVLKTNAEEVEILINESKKWKLQISKCVTIDKSIHIFMNRINTFKTIIEQVLFEKCKYGSHKLDLDNVEVQTDYTNEELPKLNLTQLRILLLKNVILRLIEFNKNSNETKRNIYIRLSINIDKNSLEKVILCGPVLSIKGDTNFNVTAEDFYKKREIDMRLMAEHKYGLRVTSNPGWQEMFEKLGHAAVTIELLQNKVNRMVTINLNDPTACSNKGASFILYNCARISTLFKEFDKRVCANVYPALPPIAEVDFNLLTQPEEWELLYMYILQFPYIVTNSIKDILDCKFNTHNLCNLLSGVCSVFSVYYRRVRILTEPRTHLFSTLHSRIYLLKAFEQVLHNGLHLLNIQPVKQM